MEKIIIFGTGNIADVAYYYFTKEGKYRVECFTVNREFIAGKEYLEKPLVEFENIQEKYSPKEYKMFIAMSYSKMNKNREKIYKEAKLKGYELASYISDKAIIADNVEIGENCFILEMNNIQPFVKIGNNVTLWSGNHIGHHSKIGENCFLASHVVVSGGVKIENNCFIGVNTTIRDHIIIKKESLIGAGAVILRDTIERGIYQGQETLPAKITSDKLKKI